MWQIISQGAAPLTAAEAEALCGHMLGVRTSDHGRRLRDAIALCLTTSVPATAAELSRLSGLTEGEVAAAQRQLAGCVAALLHTARPMSDRTSFVPTRAACASRHRLPLCTQRLRLRDRQNWRQGDGCHARPAGRQRRCARPPPRSRPPSPPRASPALRALALAAHGLGAPVASHQP